MRKYILGLIKAAADQKVITNHVQDDVDTRPRSPPHLEKRRHKTFLAERLNEPAVDVVRQAWSFFLF